MGFGHIMEDVPFLTSAGGGDAEHSLDVAVPAIGPASQEEPSADGGVSELLFGLVFFGLDIPVVDKDRQGALIHEEDTGAAPEPGQFGSGGLAQGLVDPGHEAGHFSLELGPGDAALSQSLPLGEHQLGVSHESPSVASSLALFLGEANIAVPPHASQVCGEWTVTSCTRTVGRSSR